MENISNTFLQIQELKEKIILCLNEEIDRVNPNGKNNSLIFNEEYLHQLFVDDDGEPYYMRIKEVCRNQHKNSIRIRYFMGSEETMNDNALYINGENYFLLEELVKHMEKVGFKHGYFETWEKPSKLL